MVFETILQVTGVCFFQRKLLSIEIRWLKQCNNNGDGYENTWRHGKSEFALLQTSSRLIYQMFTDISEVGGLYRLRVVPHFSSGIVGRAKRERAWKSPHARKGEEKWGTTRSLGTISKFMKDRRCTSATWKCPISRDHKTTSFLFFPDLRYMII